MNLYKEFNKGNSFSLGNPPLIPAQESWPPVDTLDSPQLFCVYSGTSIHVKRGRKGLAKFVHYNEVSLYRGSFSFTITRVKKIVRHSEDFVIWRYQCNNLLSLHFIHKFSLLIFAYFSVHNVLFSKILLPEFVYILILTKKNSWGKSVVYLVCSIRLDLSRTIRRHAPIRV